MSQTLISSKTVTAGRLPLLGFPAGANSELSVRLSADVETGTLLSVSITLASATAFTVNIPDEAKGFFVVTALTDLRFASGEDPVAINAVAESTSPIGEAEMVVGNDLASLQTRLLPDGTSRDIRFFSTTGGGIILNVF